MLILQYLLSFLLVVSILVFFHEFGHYLAAILCNVKVDEFSIGFGKTIFKKRSKSGTYWYVKLLPIGGYVKLHGDEEGSSFNVKQQSKHIFSSGKGNTLEDKNHFVKIFISIAGSLANYLLAIIVFFFGFYVFGKKHNPTNIISFINNKAPAAVAGLKVGDKITGVNDRMITDIAELNRQVNLTQSKPIKISFCRNKKTKTVIVKPMLAKELDNSFNKQPYRYLLGMQTAPVEAKKVNISTAFKLSIGRVVSLTKDSFLVIWEILKRDRNANDLGGPIVIAKHSGIAMQSGFSAIVFFLGVLSVGLGFFNLLPIPLLDGGQALFYVIELLIARPLPIIFYKAFQIIGVIFISLITMLVLLNDILSTFIR
ncbi:MAG: site-2 protease family protein [Alphaproteobacteria bacterium]|nr:site-2 protease family protein [Rickettsiales bacterium]